MEIAIESVETGIGAFGQRLEAVIDREAAGLGHPFPGEPFALAARADGAMLGGAQGRTLFGVLTVYFLAVLPEARGQGLGRRLIAAAEALGAARGAHGAFLDTYVFQAPDFYRRLGYTEIARLPGRVAAEDRIYFYKPLGAPARAEPAGGGRA